MMKQLLLLLAMVFCSVSGHCDEIITFADSNVEAICVANWDTNGDGKLSTEEAAAVTSLTYGQTSYFYGKDITSFDEFKYFTGLTSIEQYCFEYCASLTSIIIPEGVKKICSGAFSYCENLTSITIPQSLESIEGNSFRDCSNLSAVYISDLAAWCKIDFEYEGERNHGVNVHCSNPLHFAKHLYLNGVEINDLKIPDGVTDFDVAFEFCNSFTSVSIPESVTSVKEFAFRNCSKIESVLFENSLQEISSYAFEGCSSLKTVIIPDGLTTLGAGAFNKCSSLSSVTIGGGVTEIAASTFWECSSLASITIPANVNKIGRYAFYKCSGLETVQLPEGLTTIEELAFENCTSLSSITIPGSVTTIARSTFHNCGLTSVTILDGVESIEGYSFNGCNNLSSLIIQGATKLDDYAFNDCTALTSVTSNADEPEWFFPSVFPSDIYTNATLYVPTGKKSIYKSTTGWGNFKNIVEAGDSESTEPTELNDGDTFTATVSGVTFRFKVLSAAEKTCQVGIDTPLADLRQDYWGDAIVSDVPSSITVPSVVEAEDGTEFTVTAIGENAFTGYNMDSATLPSTIKTIGYMSFAWCRSMKSISLPEGLTTIGGSSFDGCGLRSVEIPSTVTSIGLQAFYGLRKLTDVISRIEEPFPLIAIQFSDPGKLTLHVPVGKVDVYKNTDGWKDFMIIEEIKEAVSITINDSGKNSYTTAEALDFSGFEDLKAYVATGFDASGTIWLTRVKQVPAGTPILIKGESQKTYEVPVLDKCVAYFENMFVGSAYEALEIDVTSADGKWNNYYIAGGAFKKVTGPRTIGAGKCYLQLPASFNAAKAGDAQKVTISKNGKSSYAPPVDVDLTDVEGLKAYAATGYDAATSTIWLTRINKIQAGEGVLLKGEAEMEYTLPSAEVQAYYGNMFVGNTGDKITINETSDDGAWTNFYLASGSFKKVSDTREIGTNKSYLHLPTSLLVSNARGKNTVGIDEWLMEELETETLLLGSIGGDDEDGTTHIDAIRNDAQPDVYYNLQGQRVDNPKKGFYIKRSTSGRLQGKNGKIVVIR